MPHWSSSGGFGTVGRVVSLRVRSRRPFVALPHQASRPRQGRADWLARHTDRREPGTPSVPSATADFLSSQILVQAQFLPTFFVPARALLKSAGSILWIDVTGRARPPQSETYVFNRRRWRPELDRHRHCFAGGPGCWRPRVCSVEIVRRCLHEIEKIVERVVVTRLLDGQGKQHVQLLGLIRA